MSWELLGRGARSELPISGKISDLGGKHGSHDLRGVWLWIQVLRQVCDGEFHIARALAIFSGIRVLLCVLKGQHGTHGVYIGARTLGQDLGSKTDLFWVNRDVSRCICCPY